MKKNERERLQQIQLISLIAYGCLAMTLVFYSLFRAESLWQREDNPRAVLEELSIKRGDILDRHGILLAETIGEGAETRRSYLYPKIGPAVGYYSFKHGTAGVEQIYNNSLRGEPRDWMSQLEHQWFHMRYIGDELKITLDIRQQQLADHLLGDRNGAIFLVSVPQGEIRAMVSHPYYDPNLLDEQFTILRESQESPLFNRVFQGRYQPGMILTPFYFAEAIEQGWVDFSEPATPFIDTPLLLEEGSELDLTCFLQEGEKQVEDAFQLGCPRLIAGLDEWDLQNFLAVLDKYQLQDALFFDQEETGEIDLITQANLLEKELVGQGSFIISPAQLLLGWMNLLQPDGVQLQIVAGDPWVERAAVELDGDNRERLIELMAERDGRFVEYLATVESGPNKINSWYLGGIPANNPQYIIVILVEDWSNLDQVQEWGREILNDSFNE